MLLVELSQFFFEEKTERLLGLLLYFYLLLSSYEPIDELLLYFM